MNQLRFIRNLTCAMFVAVMIAAWPMVTTAHDEGWECIDVEGYWGFVLHDHEFPEGACSSEWDMCHNWCELCFDSTCAYINYCEIHNGIAGACYVD